MSDKEQNHKKGPSLFDKPSLITLALGLLGSAAMHYHYSDKKASFMKSHPNYKGEDYYFGSEIKSINSKINTAKILVTGIIGYSVYAHKELTEEFSEMTKEFCEMTSNYPGFLCGITPESSE